MGRIYSLSGIGLGIYLIALGVAYFLDLSSGAGYLKMVFKFYPILPILLGIDYILPQIDPESGRSKRPEGWMVTIIILIMIGGLTYTVFNQALTTNWKDFESMIRSHNVRYFDKNEEKTDTRDFQLPDNINTVRIENHFGDTEVNLNENADKNVHTSAVIKLSIPEGQKKDTYLQQLEQLALSGKVQGNLFLIKLQQPDIEEDFRVTANITVTVPPGISVEIGNSFGGTNVTEIRGNLKIDNNNGRIEVEKVTGDATVNSRFSSVDMGEISGNLKIDTTNGSISIDKVGGSLTARNSFGSFNIGAVSGTTTITSSNGAVVIDENNGPTEIENSFGDVSLDKCYGSLRVKIRNGKLMVKAAEVDGPYDIDVKFGSISLEMPSDSKFTLDAKTSFGKIISDFDIDARKETTQETATAKINGGGPLVKLQAGNGNINLTQN